MATRYVTGLYTFTVTSVTGAAPNNVAPTVGQRYTHNGYDWYVVSSAITITTPPAPGAATGTITMLPLVNVAPISVATNGGTLTKAADAGAPSAYATIVFTGYPTQVVDVYQSQLESTTAFGTYFNNGDLVVVEYDAVLHVDTSTGTRKSAYFQANAATPGEVRVENASTTTPIVINMYDQTSNLYSNNVSNKVRVNDDANDHWIQIATGTGARDQTINFAAGGAVGGVSIDWPPVVWVETFNWYIFTVTSATASVGDTYTNNGITYTVTKAITNGTTLECTGASDPSASGNLVRTSGAGTDPIVFSAWTVILNTRDKELSPGGVSGRFRPFYNLGTGDGLNAAPGYDVKGNIMLSDFHGDLDHGNVFQYNPTTQIATFGKGGNASKTLGGTGMSAGTHSGTTVTLTVGSGHGLVANKTITVTGVTGAGANCYNGTYTLSSVTATTLVYTCRSDYATADPGNTAAVGGSIATPLGGMVIPNGSRVLYPNIHFTCAVYDATWSNRCEPICNGGATLTIKDCAFSRNWGIGASSGFSAGGYVTFANVSAFGRAVFSGIAGSLNLDNLAMTDDMTNSLTTASVIYMTSCSGTVTADYLWSLWKCTGTYAPIIAFNTCPRIISVGSCFSSSPNPTTGSFPVDFEQCVNSNEAPVLVGPLYVIGGQAQFYYSDNFHITEIYHSDKCSAGLSTTGNSAINTGYIKNLSIGKLRKMQNGVAPRSVLISGSTSATQYAVKDVIYDAQGSCTNPVNLAGRRGYASNINVTNLRSATTSGTLAVSACRYANLGSNTVPVNGALPACAFVEWANSTTSAWTSIAPFDGEPFNPFWDAVNKSTGWLRIGPMTKDNNMSHLTVVSGTEGVDYFFNSNYLYTPKTGVELIWTNYWPVRGITNMTTPTWSQSGTAAGANYQIEFSLRNNDDTSAWTAWYDCATTANWKTALDILVTQGYTSTLGFFPRFRIKTTAGATSTYARFFNYARISCTPDASWTPAEIGFIPVTTTGYISGTTCKFYDNTVPATPVRIITQSLTGTSTVLDLPYNFDATAKAFKLKYRKAGYGEIILTGSAYQKGTSVPVSQTQYVVVDEGIASAITGITIDGATNTVTLTSDHTIDDIYAYCQWWGMQIANIDYDIPLVTTDGTNYTSTYDLVLNGGDITGSGTINLGSATFTRIGSETSTLPITYSSGTGVFGNITVAGLIANSRVYINNTTDNIEIYNDVVVGTSVSIPVTWTADKALDLRVTNVSGITAYLPYQSAGTLTSGMASFTASQALDTVYNTNAIDGSTVTEFTADYPNIEVDINDGDGVTSVKRIYASFQYMMHSSQGIVYFFNGITAQDTLNYQVNTNIVDLKLDNVGALPVVIGDAYLYRDDSSTVISSLSPSIQMDPKRAYGVINDIWSTDLTNYTTTNTAGALMKKASKPKISL